VAKTSKAKAIIRIAKEEPVKKTYEKPEFV
jgi:hypothetical protein